MIKTWNRSIFDSNKLKINENRLLGIQKHRYGTKSVQISNLEISISWKNKLNDKSSV